MARFSSAGVELAFDDINPAAGAGRPIVLVHGFAANRTETWRRLGWMGALERRARRAIALDLRGHGESDKPHDSAAYHRDQMSADILRLMDHLDVLSADLIGYSLGAHLAAGAAASAPARFANLVLGGVGARTLERPGPAATAMTLAEAMRADSAEAITEPTLRGFRRFAELQGEDRLALAACAEGAGPMLADNLGRILVPTLVVAGALDDIAGDPTAVAARVPGAVGLTIAGCDHFSATPHALFKAAVFDFLEGWVDDPWNG